MLLQAITLSVLGLLLIVAAAWDIRRRRIPNAVNAAVCATGMTAALVCGGWGNVLSGLGACLVVVALLWWPWLTGRIGGGDVKLTGAAATSVGFSLLPEYLLGTALAGGVVAAICYLFSSGGARHQMVLNLKLASFGIAPEPPLRGGNGRVSVPFGVAAAASALALILLRRSL